MSNKKEQQKNKRAVQGFQEKVSIYVGLGHQFIVPELQVKVASVGYFVWAFYTQHNSSASSDLREGDEPDGGGETLEHVRVC